MIAGGNHTAIQNTGVAIPIVQREPGPVNLNKQRHEAQNALTRLMPVMNETPDLTSVHYTEYYCTCEKNDCQALFTCDQRTLTKIFLHGKITGQQYADMVELGSEGSAAGGG